MMKQVDLTSLVLGNGGSSFFVAILKKAMNSNWKHRLIYHKEKYLKKIKRRKNFQIMERRVLKDKMQKKKEHKKTI